MSFDLNHFFTSPQLHSLLGFPTKLIPTKFNFHTSPPNYSYSRICFYLIFYTFNVLIALIQEWGNQRSFFIFYFINNCNVPF